MDMDHLGTDSAGLGPPKGRSVSGPAGGFAAFGVAVALMWWVAAPIQQALGLLGLAITEVMLLGVGVAFALAGRQPMGQVFPLRLPTVRQLAATLVLWGGYLGLALSSTLAVAYYFPTQVFGVSESLGNLLTSWPLPLALLVSALMPAICEEGLCRGFIQHSLRGWNRWVSMTVVALLFGALHFSLYRLLPTAILGFALAYLRDRTGSLWPPMVLHFVNNAFSTVSGYLSDAGTAQLEASGMDILGMAPALICFYALASPAAIFAGTQLLYPPRPLGQRRSWRDKRWQIILVAVLTLLLLAGFIAGMAPYFDDLARQGQQVFSLAALVPRLIF